MQSRRLHRLSRFRRNKRRLRDRLRQRIFFREDRMKPEAMAKPRVVVLTGAGISAESGSKPSARPMACGKSIGWKMWRRRKASPAIRRWCRRSTTPVVVSCRVRKSRRTRRIWRWRVWRICWATILLVTQNIDNLHERAGNRRVIHMHGELLKVRCSWSGQVLEWTGDVTAEDKCHCCQFPAALRPHVVWFGEMPLGMDEIYSALADADIFIAIGTSGHVYPAAGFVHEARLHGAHTVELNLEPSQVGSEFAEKHYGLASEVVPAFIDKLLQENAL